MRSELPGPLIRWIVASLLALAAVAASPSWAQDAGPKAQNSASLGTVFVYGNEAIPGHALLGEYGNGGAKGAGRAEYIWLPVEGGKAIPVGMYKGGKFYAIHSDHLGTPRLITNEAKVPVWQWPYSAFGNNKPTGVLKATARPQQATTNQPVLLKATKPALENNLRHDGQYFDEETGMFYNGHRTYCASCGSYTQADPIGQEGGLNLFSYVQGNPLSFTDPEGLQALRPPRGAGAAQPMFSTIGPNRGEVVGPYSTTTQSQTVNGINASRGRMGNYSENLLDFFARNTNGPINMSTTRDGNLRFETTLPNGTRMQYREGPNGSRVNIFPPGGTAETMHAPFAIGGVCLR